MSGPRVPQGALYKIILVPTSKLHGLGLSTLLRNYDAQHEATLSLHEEGAQQDIWRSEIKMEY